MCVCVCVCVCASVSVLVCVCVCVCVEWIWILLSDEEFSTTHPLDLERHYLLQAQDVNLCIEYETM